MTSDYPNVETCDPRQCLASKIMKSHRLINAIFRKHLKPFGITNSQLSILFILSKKTMVTQRNLSEILYLEKSSVNRNLTRLVDQNLVDRRSFPEIKITENGLGLLNKVIPAWNKAMDETTEKIGFKGVQALDSLLMELTK